MMARKYITIIALAGMLIFCSTQALAKGGSKAMPPPIVNVEKVQTIMWQPTIQSTGTLSAYNGIVVKSETSGRVINIYFQSGQLVKKGQPLVQIYPDIIQANLDKAKSELKLSKLDYERFIKLYRKNFYSNADLDKAKTNVDSAQAQVNELTAELNQTMIRATFDGRAGLRLVSIGEYLTIGSPIVNLQTLDPLRVDFSVPEKYMGTIKIGDQVVIRSEAYRGRIFRGTIYATDSLIDPTTRTLDVRASLPNNQFQLLPGAFVEVTIYLGQPKSMIAIPQIAALYSTDGDYVFRAINGKAVKTSIKQGEKLENGKVVILSGLQVGDEIITDGQLKVDDGEPFMTTQQMQQMMMQKSLHGKK